MRNPARILLVVIAALGLMLGTFGVWLYLALHRVPEFYARVLTADPDGQARASQQLLKQSAALASDTQKEGYWTALFSMDQINGWLAVDLVKNHRKLLPVGIHEPRVVIQPGTVILACRYEGAVAMVLSVEADLYLSQPDQIALRLKHVRAGTVPMPLRRVIDGISAAAAQADLDLQWRQIDGDPVALIRLSEAARPQSARLESLEVRDGEIYVAGSTSKRQR